MPLIERIGDISALPQVTLPVLPRIYDQRIFAQSGSESSGEAILGLRDCDKMNVVIHQAVRPNGDAVLMGCPTQEDQEEGPIFVREKNPLTPIPALDKVVGTSRNDEPDKFGQSRALITRDAGSDRKFSGWGKNG
jgi:hypothetical protein